MVTAAKVRAPIASAPVAAALSVLRSVLWALSLAATAPAQDAAPTGEGEPPGRLGDLVAAGESALASEDPVRSWRTFQELALLAPDRVDGAVGIGRSHLLLGRAAMALAWAECALQRDAGRQDAMTLAVRARIRARAFDEAVAAAAVFVARARAPGAELLAAQASALFRVQRTDEAAAVYRQVLGCDPEHGEAHLRLGSGLSAPREAAITESILAAVMRTQAGDLAGAIALLRTALAADPGNPVVHRLLGEAVLMRRTLASMALNDGAFAALRAALPAADTTALPIADFVPAYAGLSGPRRLVVERACALFGRRLAKLVAIGGRHDLLLEIDRTTDAPARAGLRGRRTFDGRVWDDVRGIGGLSAATGIEALDDAAQFGFDTLAHEIAHQVHYFALLPIDRARIRELYVDAKRHGRCLDFYAATNEAEYFGQGVEAFASLCKRPGGETTHGHTRFELRRVDRALHDFIAGLVDHDPLATAARTTLLQHAIAVALRVGRPEDAAQAADMLPPGPIRAAAIPATAAAVRAARDL